MKRTLLFLFSLVAFLIPFNLAAENFALSFMTEQGQVEPDGYYWNVAPGEVFYIICGVDDASLVTPGATLTFTNDMDYSVDVPIEKCDWGYENWFQVTIPSNAVPDTYFYIPEGTFCETGNPEMVNAEEYCFLSITGGGAEFSWDAETTSVQFLPVNGSVLESVPGESGHVFVQVFTDFQGSGENLENAAVEGSASLISITGPTGAELLTVTSCVASDFPYAVNFYDRGIMLSFDGKVKTPGEYTITFPAGYFKVGDEANPEPISVTYSIAANAFLDYTVSPEPGKEINNVAQELDEIRITFPSITQRIDVESNVVTVNDESTTFMGGDGYILTYGSWLPEMSADRKYSVVIPAGALSYTEGGTTVRNDEAIEFEYSVAVNYFEGVTYSPANDAYDELPDGVVFTFPQATDQMVSLAEGSSLLVNGVNVADKCSMGNGTVTFPAELFTDLPKNKEFSVVIPFGALHIDDQTNTEAYEAKYTLNGPIVVEYEISTVMDKAGNAYAPSKFGEIPNIVSFEVKPDFGWQGTGSMFSPQYTPVWSDELLSQITLVNEEGLEYHPSSYTKLGSMLAAGRSIRLTFDPEVNQGGVYTLIIPDGFISAQEGSAVKAFAGATFPNIFTVLEAKPDYFEGAKFVEPTSEEGNGEVKSISNFIVEFPAAAGKKAELVYETDKYDTPEDPWILEGKLRILFTNLATGEAETLNMAKGMTFSINESNQLVLSIPETTACGTYEAIIEPNAVSIDGVKNPEIKSEQYTITPNFFQGAYFSVPAENAVVKNISEFVVWFPNLYNQTLEFVGSADNAASVIKIEDAEGNTYPVTSASISSTTLTFNVDEISAPGEYTVTVEPNALTVRGQENSEPIVTNFVIKPLYFKDAAFVAPVDGETYESVDEFEITLPGFEGHEDQTLNINYSAISITPKAGGNIVHPEEENVTFEGTTLKFTTEPYIYNGEYEVVVSPYALEVDGVYNEEALQLTFTIEQMAFPEFTVEPAEGDVRSLNDLVVTFTDPVKVADDELKVTVAGEDVEAVLSEDGTTLTIPYEQTALTENIEVVIPADMFTVGVGASKNEEATYTYTVVPEFIANPKFRPVLNANGVGTIESLNSFVIDFDNNALPEGLAPLTEEQVRKITVSRELDGVPETYYGYFSNAEGEGTQFVEGSGNCEVDVRFADADNNPVDLYKAATYVITIPAGVFVDARTAELGLQTVNNARTATYNVQELPYYFQGSVWTPAKDSKVVHLGDITVDFPNRKGTSTETGDFDYDVEPNKAAVITIGETELAYGEGWEVKDNILIIHADENVPGDYVVSIPDALITIHSVENTAVEVTYTIEKPNYFEGAAFTAPAPGDVTSLKEMTVSFPAKSTFTPVLNADAKITVTRAKGTPVEATGSINADGELVITLAEEITLGGTYTVNVPAGAVSIDDLASTKAITAVYTIEKADYFAGAKFTSPEPGVVDALDAFTVEFPGKLDFVPVLKTGAAATITVTSDKGVEVKASAAEINAEGNLQITLANEITKAGVYTVTVPAGALSIDEVANATAITAEYTIELKTDPEWWAQVQFEPAGGATSAEAAVVKQLASIGVYFPSEVSYTEGIKAGRMNTATSDLEEVAGTAAGSESVLSFSTTIEAGEYIVNIPAGMWISQVGGPNPEYTFYYKINELPYADFWTAEFIPADEAEVEAVSKVNVVFPNALGAIEAGDVTVTLKNNNNSTSSYEGTVSFDAETGYVDFGKIIAAPGVYVMNIPEGAWTSEYTKYAKSPAYELTFTVKDLEESETAFVDAKWMNGDKGASFSGGYIELPNKPNEYATYVLEGSQSLIKAVGPDGVAINCESAGRYSGGIYLNFEEQIAAGEYKVTVPKGFVTLCAKGSDFGPDPDQPKFINPEFTLVYTVEAAEPVEFNYSFQVVKADGSVATEDELDSLEGVSGIKVTTDVKFTWDDWKLCYEAYLTNGTNEVNFDKQISTQGNYTYVLSYNEPLTEPGTYSLYVPAGLIKDSENGDKAAEINVENLFTIVEPEAKTIDWSKVVFAPAEGEVKSISGIDVTFPDNVVKGEKASATLTLAGGQPVNAQGFMMDGVTDQCTVIFSSTDAAGEYTVTIAEGSFVNAENFEDVSPEFTLKYTIAQVLDAEYWSDPTWYPAQGSEIESLPMGMVQVKFPNSDGWVAEGQDIWMAKLVNNTTGTVYEYAQSWENDNYDGGVIFFNSQKDITEAGEYTLTLPAASYYSINGKAEDSPALELNFSIAAGEEPATPIDWSKVTFDPADGDDELTELGLIDVNFPAMVAKGAAAKATRTNAAGESVDATGFMMINEGDTQCSLMFSTTDEPGEYTVTVAAGSFVNPEDAEDLSPEFTLHYTVVETETVDTWATENQIWTPANGATVEELSQIRVELKGLKDVLIPENDDIFIVKNVTTGEEFRALADEYNNTDGVIIFVNTFWEPITVTAPGTYEVSVPAGVWSADGQLNPEILLTYVIEGGSVEPGIDTMLDKWTSDPEDGATVATLDAVTITFPDLGADYALVPVDYEAELVAEDGTTYRVSLDFVELKGSFMFPTAIEAKMTEQAPAGTYTLVIPAGTVQIGDLEDWDGIYDIYNKEIRIEYTVTEGVGILSVVGEADTYTIIDYAGRVITRNGDADAVRNLEKGIYIINGRKVVIRK